MGKCRMSRESLESLESQDLLRQDERNYWTTMEKVLSKGGKNLVSIETQNQARSGNSALGFQETRTSVKLTHAKGTNYYFFSSFKVILFVLILKQILTRMVVNCLIAH